MVKIQRRAAFDIVLAVGLGSFVQVRIAQGAMIGARWWVVPLFLLVGWPFAVRRTYPLQVLLVIDLAIVVQAAATNHAVEGLFLLLPFVVAVYSVAAWGSHRQALIGLGASVLTIAMQTVFDPLVRTPEEKSAAAFFGVLELLFWVAGFAMHSRRRTRAAEALAVRLEAAHLVAVRDERRRIAGELHDVIAHHLSVIVVQAVAAQGVLERDSDRAGAPLTHIETCGREALQELRRLVGVMRSNDGDPLSPQPGLEDLPDLADRLARSGVKVELRVDRGPDKVPTAVELSAFRIVQEALTNTLKHGSARTVTVRVQCSEEAVRVEVLDDGTGAAPSLGGGGHGLVGMRERAELFGGTLFAGPRAAGGFAVRATLPLPERP